MVSAYYSSPCFFSASFSACPLCGRLWGAFPHQKRHLVQQKPRENILCAETLYHSYVVQLAQCALEAFPDPRQIVLLERPASRLSEYFKVTLRGFLVRLGAHGGAAQQHSAPFTHELRKWIPDNDSLVLGVLLLRQFGQIDCSEQRTTAAKGRKTNFRASWGALQHGTDFAPWNEKPPHWREDNGVAQNVA